MGGLLGDRRSRRLLVAVGTLATCALGGSVGAGFDSSFGVGPTRGVVQVAPVFPYSTVAVAALDDGSVIVAQPSEVRKFSATGVLDPAFGSGGVVPVPALAPTSVDVDASGRILVTGSRLDTGIGSSQDPVLVRMSSDGVIDPGFGGVIGFVRYRVSRPFEISSYISVTNYDYVGGRACIHRLRASDGVLDSAFGSGGSACVEGLGFDGSDTSVTGAFGGRLSNGSYVLYVFAMTGGAADVSGTAIRVISFSPTGTQIGAVTTIPEIAGEFLMSGVVGPDGSLFVSGQRSSSTDGFVRKYQNQSLVASFAAHGRTPGVATMTGLRAERLVVLPDGRLLALGSVSGVAGQARMLTADGRPDGALDPGASAPDRLTLPKGSYATFTPTTGSFWDADLTPSGKLVLGGTEALEVGFFRSHESSVVAMSDPIGPSNPVTSVGAFVPVVPERLLDTRQEGQVGYAGVKPGPASVVRLQVTGAGRTKVPSSATAVVLTVTGTEATDDGFVTVWPCGAERPVASNLNLERGGTRPNVVVSGMTDGAVCLYTQNGAHLLADVTGYVASSTEFAPVTPRRLLDTRSDTRVGYSGTKPGAGAVVTVQVTGGSGLAPIGTPAVAFNLTATEVEQGTFVTAWACGERRPPTSNLNVLAGQTIPNLVIAPVSASGTVCLYTLNPAHLIVDLAGWFPAGSSYTAVTPDRVLDTRSPFQIGYTGPTPSAGAVVEVQIAGRVGVPADATAAVLNVAGVDAPAPGFVTVWPCGADRPLASNLNLDTGNAAANLVMTGIGIDGKICIYTRSGADFVADIFGTFTPR